MKRIVLLLAAAFAFHQPVSSQICHFNHFSIRDGLPQSSVFSVMQDSRGYIWLGTLGGGVACFDGAGFEIFNTSNGLAGNMIRSMFEDSRGNLWFGTDQGLSIYDGYAINNLDTAHGLLGNQVLSIYETADHSIWAGTDEGLNRLNWLSNDSIRVTNFGMNRGLPYRLVFDIYEDGAGKLWLATYNDGVIILGLSDGELTGIETLNREFVPALTILDLEPDQDGNLWVGTGGSGAFRLDLDQQGVPRSVFQLDRDNGLTDMTVWSIAADKEGIVWIGTGEGGIHAFSEGEVRYYNQQQGAPSNQILCLLVDRDGALWAGSNDNGFFRYIGDHFFHFDERSGLTHNAVSGVIQDKDGNFWFTSYGGGLSRLSAGNGRAVVTNYGEKQGLPDSKLNGVSQAPDGDLWLATSNHGLVKYDGRRFINLTTQNGLVNNQLNAVLADSRGYVWAGTRSSGICKYDGRGFFCLREGDEFGMVNNLIQCIFEDREGNTWVGTWDGLVRFTTDAMTSFDEEEGLFYRNIHSLAQDSSGNIWIGTFGGGLFRLDVASEDKIFIHRVADDKILGSNNISSLLFADSYTVIVGTDKGFDRLSINDAGEVLSVRSYESSDGFSGQENNLNAICLDNQKRIWFGTVRGLTCYDPSKEKVLTGSPTPYISSLLLSYEEVDWTARGDSVTPWFGLPENLKLSFFENRISFGFKALSFSNPGKLVYRYRLLPYDTLWSPPRKETQVTYPGLPPGEYTFEVSAMNETGRWSEIPARYSFIIKPPFYQAWWFILIMVLTTLFVIYIFIRLRERKLLREKRELEEKVQERTREIRKQKAEIEDKNRILEDANLQITTQKELIEQKNRDITDSIQYAKKIQDAVLPAEILLRENLADSFVIYKPKDIVSGDFYWVNKKDGILVLAAADCTGHGVPGAFMSMLGISFLDEIVARENNTDPAEILNLLRENIIVSLKQKELTSETKDGMDIAVCCLDTASGVMEYAGANNPLYMIRDGMLREIKADRMPVSIHEKMESFTRHSLEVLAGDQFYLFSDGFADQFGGREGKKFKYRPFKDLLVHVHGKDMKEQKVMLEDTFENWRKGPGPDGKGYEQIDDVVILAFRI